MRTTRVFLPLWIVFCGAAGAQNAAAPAAQPPDQGQEPVYGVVVEEVRVPFIVTDNRNRLITNLTREDFEVLEDGQKQVINNFSRETDVPLRIGLLVDTSNSIRDRLDFEQRAAAEFLRNILRPGKDKAMLGSFDSMAELLQDFTDDLDKLVGAIQLMRAGGGTALYDAIYYASRDRLMVEAPLSSEFRRALVVLSDGEDNQSRFSRLQTLEMARRAEVTIYTISTNIKGTRLRGDEVLKEFSEESGGRFFQPSSWEDLDEAFQAINDELRSQYILVFRPTTPRDGRYHEIEIVPKQKGLKVRARRGYFATQPLGVLPSNVSPAGRQ
ncbi:MAG TPA: VWA domain-containing protein [Terriglobia bacterium]|nr:VWA domain-containing protein [Terriglobia bacterium]